MIRKFALAAFVVGLCVLPVLAQKAKTPIVRKAVESRLKPPATRKFDHSMELTSEFDKFKNSTKVALRIPGNESGAAYFAFFFTGEKLATPPKDILFQYFENEDSFLLPVTDFIVLADGTRLRLRLTQLPAVGAKAQFFTKLNYLTFLRIANSANVEMKIGQTEITFSSEAIEALKDFASRTSPAFYKQAKLAGDKRLEARFKREAVDLLILSSNNKSRIKEVLASTQDAVRIARESTDVDLIVSSSLQALKFYTENSDAFPNSLLKMLIENATGDLAASAMVRGIKAGKIKTDDPDVKPFLDVAITQNGLRKVPQEEWAAILLSKAENGINDALSIASAAGMTNE